jgi:PKD repeat protein
MKRDWSFSYLCAGCVVIMLAVLAAPAAGVMGPALGAVDISDNNMRMVVVATKEECSAACDAEPACAAATFVLPGTIQGPDGHCYLKSASMPQTDNFNCYSFVKLVILPVTVCAMSNPKADFGMLAAGNKPPKGFAPIVVQFTDMSSGAYGWSWDFGDGSAVSTDKNPVHTYTVGSPGGTYYDVTLTVTGSCTGETSTSKKSQVVRVFDNIGFLGLASTPGGASVSIDGSPVAGSTSTVPGEPLHLTPGSHTVRLMLDGYKDYTATATVVNGQTATLFAILEKNPSGTPSSPTSSPSATGSLQITTAPDGAAVSVDGGSRGTTPLTVSGLAAGSHTVSLTKDGYTDYTGTLTLPGGKTTLLNITLVPVQVNPAATIPSQFPAHGTAAATTQSLQIPQGTMPPTATSAPSVPGSLTVRSTPDGANVYLDGEKVGITPVLVQDAKPGTHRLLLTLQGYGDISQAVDVTGGSDNEVNVTFTGKKTPGFAAPVSLAALAFVLLVLPGRKTGGGSQ